MQTDQALANSIIGTFTSRLYLDVLPVAIFHSAACCVFCTFYVFVVGVIINQRLPSVNPHVSGMASPTYIMRAQHNFKNTSVTVCIVAAAVSARLYTYFAHLKPALSRCLTI